MLTLNLLIVQYYNVHIPIPTVTGQNDRSLKKNNIFYTLLRTVTTRCIDLVNETWTIIIAANIFNTWSKMLNRETGIKSK